jgi:trigger factor
MKSAVETIGPTRVKLTVEVPFEELKPSLDQAYRTVGEQVTIKGFRRGHVPPRLVDQYVGRGTVLEQAINDALPSLYGEAVREAEVDILGHPEIEVTQLTDGDQLVFTAEVDVRPKFDVPDVAGLTVTVADAEVADDEVEQQLESLRDRFATLSSVERPAANGDFVSLDLAATIDGEPVPDATASNLSYEVGSDSLVAGLDDAIVGLAAGEAKEFETQLRSGDQGGHTAQASVTVKSVRAKDVPALDDDFAQTASEFDTIAELRADLRERLGRVRRMAQAAEARDKVVEGLLERVEVPVPEHVLADEVAFRLQSLDEQLSQMGASRSDYAEAEGIELEAIESDFRTNSEQAIRAQFILDEIARREELTVDEAELTEAIVRHAAQARVSPEQYAQQVVAGGNLGSLMSETLRGKALAHVLEHAQITDASGRPVDLDALLDREARQEIAESGGEAGDDAAGAPAADANPEAGEAAATL